MNKTRQLILVGAGHAHLHLIGRVGDYVDRGWGVRVIAPGPFWYSGLGPALLGGDAEPGEDTVNVRPLLEQAGAEFIEDVVTDIQAESQRLQLQNHSELSFDALSLNVGSQIVGPPGTRKFATPVKPISGLWNLRKEILARPKSFQALRVLVVGTGDAGLEVAGNLRKLLSEIDQPHQITLLGAAAHLLPGQPQRAARLLEASFVRQGIGFRLQNRVAEIGPETVRLESGEELPSDLTVVATGVVPSELLRNSGLPVSDEGALRVNSFLQNPRHPRIFGAGDCIHFEPKPLPRVGVHAVRQAPVLHHNLQAFLAGRPLRPYQPQSAYLLIRNLGDGTGLLTWKGLALRGRWALAFKNWLDASFVRQYQNG